MPVRGRRPGEWCSMRRMRRNGPARGEIVILVRLETSPDDIRGMNASRGILTARGGMTSHAALVGRQMGKVCIVGLQRP